MTVEEIIKATREGGILAPVGAKTFAVLYVGADDKMDAAGTIANEHADEIAFWIMMQKRRSQMPSEPVADREDPEVEVVE